MAEVSMQADYQQTRREDSNVQHPIHRHGRAQKTIAYCDNVSFVVNAGFIDEVFLRLAGERVDELLDEIGDRIPEDTYDYMLAKWGVGAQLRKLWGWKIWGYFNLFTLPISLGTNDVIRVGSVDPASNPCSGLPANSPEPNQDSCSP